MKKFTRIKERGGHQYAYEITPYYDPGTKNTKQKSRYLGKVVDDEIVPPRSYKPPKYSFDYGAFLPFMKVQKELAIGDILRSILPKRQADTVLTVALNRLVQPVAMTNVRTWFEGTYLSKEYGDLPLSSQSLSELMERLGGSDIHMEFSRHFIERVGKGSPILYDITSLSSTSALMDILEYGYSRDRESLPQLNVSMVAHKDKGIPLFYDIHPGSVVDVTTLKNTIKKLGALGLKKPAMILDRGFFSGPNLKELVGGKHSFVMPASYAMKAVQSLVTHARRDIERASHLVRYDGATLFVKAVRLDLEKVSVDGYVYYDMKREREEKSRFYGRLHEVMDQLKKRKLREKERPRKVFDNIAGKMAKYIRWSVVDAGFEVKAKDKTVSRRVNRMGFTVVVQRGGHSWEEVLAWSRERDAIEKMFKQLKSDIEVRPLRAHKTEVARGWVFVAFVSLILRSRLVRLMKETGLSKKYSIPSLLLVMNRLKRVELSDSTVFNTEVTKRQRLILEALDIEP